MAQYTLNTELNGIEISFDAKPAAETLTALKSAGYRWHRQKKVWYAKQTAERLTLAESLAGLSEAPQAIDRQKELRAVYMDEIRKCWDSPRMIDYFEKDGGYIVELDNDDIACIEKPRIETSFCYGYGYCGISTQEDEDRASDMAQHAATNEQYFIDKNMEEINRMIDILSGQSDVHYVVYKQLAYTGQESGAKLKSISFDRYNRVYDDMPAEVLSDNEMAAMLAGYREVKRQFEKRLKTYLKRYGLTKIRTWTYLSD